MDNKEQKAARIGVEYAHALARPVLEPEPMTEAHGDLGQCGRVLPPGSLLGWGVAGGVG
jgi:hypothetical protein